MGSLYRLGQKFVDFCNVVQQNQNSEVTVPSSKVLYDVSTPIELDLSTLTWSVSYSSYSFAYRIGKIVLMQLQFPNAVVNQSQLFSNLPVEFRPPTYVWGTIREINGGDKYSMIQITPSGEGVAFGEMEKTNSYVTFLYFAQ